MNKLTNYHTSNSVINNQNLNKEEIKTQLEVPNNQQNVKTEADNQII